MKILVGVSGGVAAYKAAELVRELQQRGAAVQVVMTEAAERFIAPLMFAALTGKPVLRSLWQSEATPDEDAQGSIEHIAVAQSIDAFVIAPATADVLAKLAHGLAGDYLSTVFLATKAPVIVAPAMNVNMWENAATQANVELLRQRGVAIVPPEAGYLACGMTGGGRLASIVKIADEVMRVAERRSDLAGETVLVTAGGTRESVDPVRYLGNRSSGRMGHALAEAAYERGAQVILITASSLQPPAGCSVLRVTSAQEMQDAVLAALPVASLVFMAAAVADFRPRSVSSAKIRRGGSLTLELEPTEDIVKSIVARRAPGTRVIAFAAEMRNLEANGREKLRRKGVDALVANDVSQQHLGFDSERNAGLFLTADETIVLEENSKRVMADRILDRAMRLPVPALEMLARG